MDDVSLLKMLPRHMQDDIKVAAYGPIMQAHPLFKHVATRNSGTTFIRTICCHAVKQKTILVGDRLYAENIPVTEMIFVVKGTLHYSDVADSQADTPLKVSEGEWACEAALWTDQASLNGPLVADIARCELLVIDAV
eukprot:CAMPEP_0180443402 /NCGR_PEP_ID=MMETSP1036_2-20121128/14654_1 /TAXON_ID=632150 /ORGANISM="Azadinium spinosum, Strain 3D9" /LENGTH=136 /DNA_ID=CAMNT_0022449709 /DNA_START=93 /DNA_END=499 /DNA_ORIENTATION=+